MKLYDVTCESMPAPLAVTVPAPVFSWKLQADEGNVFQTACRITVLTEGSEPVWDSGIISSGSTVGIPYAGKPLQPCTRYEYQVTAWNENREAASSGPCIFETAFFDPEEWEAKWIEPDALPQLKENPLAEAYREWGDTLAALMRGEHVPLRTEGDIMADLPLEPYDPAVLFRKTFSCPRKIRRARLYITAHGIYDIRINGKAVTDTLLNPGFTTYDKRILYQVYEAEPLLQETNAISVTVADGWYKGKIAIGRGCEYGETPGLLLKLIIWYQDGSIQTVESDENWKFSCDSPVRLADLFLGEIFDARKDGCDPSLFSYDDSSWKPVRISEQPGPAPEAQNYPPVRILEELPAKKVWTAPNGDTLVDFGQNLAGVIRAEIDGTEGEEITFEHGETLDKDGNFFYIFSNTNKAQKDTFLCRGTGAEIYQPRFTYHGFRYVRVTGGRGWTKEKFTALALGTDNKAAGSFSCSDPQLNQLQNNIFWSQRSNNITIPTDCPTREKAGWTGDVVVYGATALFNQEMTAFYKDWLKSIRAEQLDNGIIQGTVPQIKCYISQAGMGSLGWGDVILTLPWQLYQLWGEKSVLRDNYAAMGKWLEAMKKAAYELPNAYNTPGSADSGIENMTGRRLENQHYLINSGFHFGDWIIPSVVNEQGFTDGPRSSFLTMNYADTSLLAHIADLYAQISDILGEKENAASSRSYAQRVREAFAEEYITADQRLGQEMQGNYILALKYNMIPQENAPAFAGRLNELIVQNGCRLDTGFMSTPHILDILCDYGFSETAWKVLFQKECPSWLYEIENGATTLWENWDAIRPDGKIGDCSFNHYAFGCVGDFMYRRILGIQNAGIGYDRIRIAPEYGVPLTGAKGSFESIHGTIQVSWEKKDGRISICGRLPANTRGIICLPDGAEKELANGTFAFSCELQQTSK